MAHIKKKLLIVFLLFLSSVITITIFSFVTSPLYGNKYLFDSSLFEVIGKGWGQGLVPYRDLWDSKGPYVFFTNMIGYLIGGKRGIFALEIINIFITKLWLYKTLRLSFNKVVSFVISALCVGLFISIFWYYGNTQSEWCLPFLAASIYYIYNYALSKEYNHKPIGAFVYGLTIGISIMSRPTNCIYVLISVFIIFLMLVYKKEWQNLLKNIGAGFLGVLISTLPFIVYFAINDALYDMVYATILYNIKYISFETPKNNNFATFLGVLMISPTLFIGFYIIIKSVIKKHYKILFVFLLPTYLSLTYLSFCSFGFIHYFSIFLPICIVLLALFHEDSSALSVKIPFLIFIAYFGLYCAIIIVPDEMPDRLFYDFIAIEEELIEDVPKNASFLAINEPGLHEIYLKYNIFPNNKYFYYQDIYALIDENTKNDIINDFSNKLPEYVYFSDITDTSLVYKMPTIDNTIYSYYLKTYYTIIKHKTALYEGTPVNFYLLQLKPK